MGILIYWLVLLGWESMETQILQTGSFFANILRTIYCEMTFLASPSSAMTMFSEKPRNLTIPIGDARVCCSLQARGMTESTLGTHARWWRPCSRKLAQRRLRKSSHTKTPKEDTAELLITVNAPTCGR